MYESDVSTVNTALTNANPIIFSDDTINRILNLTTKTNDATTRFDSVAPDANGNVTVSAGAEVVFVATSDIFQTTVKPPVNAPVVIFQGRGGVVATLNDGITTPSGNQSQVDRIVVGSSGGDKIIVADAKNTQVVLGSGDSSVQAGGGVDTVYAGLGNSTIVGGSGDYAVVKLAGNAANYTVTQNSGRAIVTDMTTHKTTDISKIQYVQLDNGNALIFAKNSVEGQVATLYHTAFGRTAEAGGLDYWFDVVKGGATLKQVADAFTHSAEFAAMAAKTDVAFIESLYQNTFNRSADAGGVAFWQDSLAQGKTRGDLIADFATIAIQNVQHTAHNQEAQVIGNVSIVTGII